jgi:hypothetical protein
MAYLALLGILTLAMCVEIGDLILGLLGYY